jgi:asparagine synthetase B (glutamine-hydrolysing)
MSMANSLEVRSPLLDQKVIEFAARVPSRFKLHGREKKYILKKALRDVLPSQVLQRQKHGFESPSTSGSATNCAQWPKRIPCTMGLGLIFQHPCH